MTADDSEPPLNWVPPDPGELNEVLPAFEVEQLLGRGGMGAVYLATQKSLGRQVAIKLLPPEFSTAATFAERFKREARALAELTHPNIVEIFDFGETVAGHYYFVMEYVDGRDFHQLIRSGNLDTGDTLMAISQVCDALSYAHRKGYIHRDIKPANIFLDSEGRVKVGDFGLAKLTGPQAVDESLTMTGTAVGTPQYLAPEVFSGTSPVDHRSDVYSLGVMFYEMLTGHIPRGNFDPPSKRVNVDDRLDDVVLKAMAEQPERRYSSAAEMGVEVENMRNSPAKPAVGKGSRPVVGIFAGSLLVLGAAALYIYFFRGNDRDHETLTGIRIEQGNIPKLEGVAAVSKKNPAKPDTDPLPSVSVAPARPLPDPPEKRKAVPPPNSVSSASPGNGQGRPRPFSGATGNRYENHLGMKFVSLGTNTSGNKILMSIWETRVQDYSVFAESNPDIDRKWKNLFYEDTRQKLHSQGADHPVVKINWSDATKFCEWLSKIEVEKGLIGTRDRYRLPTDTEWSFALGIGDQEDPGASPSEKDDLLVDVYPWGNERPPPNNAGNYSGVESASRFRMDEFDDGFPFTAPVGSFSPNQAGLYDMGGNVWEWCHDWYHPTSIARKRVARGGSWVDSNGFGLRSSARADLVPDIRNESTGFRCVLEFGKKAE